MMTTRRTRSRWLTTLVAGLCTGAIGLVACQSSTPAQERTDDAAGFREFSARVQAYVKLQQTAAAGIPALKTTDLPEIISAHQQALARKIREARPDAKAGDIFTPAACESFRRASQTTLTGPNASGSRAYMEAGAPDPAMPLAVNGIYSSTQPITALSPALLAAYPPLPPELAYRVVGRSLILIDVKSNLVVDIARLILPPA